MVFDPLAPLRKDAARVAKSLGFSANPGQQEARLATAQDLKKLTFLYGGFLYSVEEIRDAVMDRNLNKLIEEIQRGKRDIQQLSSTAPDHIREEYLSKILESFDTFEFNVRVDLDKYPDRAWEEIEEHLWEFRDRNAQYLIMAMKDLSLYTVR